MSPKRPYDESSAWAISQVPRVSYQDPRDAIHPMEKTWDARRLESKRQLVRSRVPFNAAEDPEFAETTEANEAWYQAVLNTEPGPVGVRWDDFPTVVIPITEMHQELYRRFQLRASLAFGDGDFEKAIESYRFILKVAARERTVPFGTNQFVGIDITRAGTDTVCSGILKVKQVPENILRELDNIRPPNVPNKVWLQALMLERIQWLTEFQETHRNRASSGEHSQYADAFGRPAGNWFVKRLDFEVAMAATAQAYHDAIAPFQIEDYLESIAAMNKFNAAIATKWKGVGNTQSPATLMQLVTADHTARVCREAALMYSNMRAYPARMQNNWRRLRLTIRLHVYRSKHGRWPDSLDELLNLPGWEATDRELFIDAFTGKPFNYRRTEDGFILQSFGPNSVDDIRDQLPTDAYGWRYSIGDDEFWPWPHPRYQIDISPPQPATP